MGAGDRLRRVALARLADHRESSSDSSPPANAEPRSIAFPPTLLIFATVFLLPAWPWLSGDVTIPWDAKSYFFPHVQFLATSLARGDLPWWSPNVFGGWEEISDPQSLLFSPPYALLAALSPEVSLRGFDSVTFLYLFMGGTGLILFFRDRGWHPAGAIVAAMAFAFGGSANARLQHTGQIVSLCYLPLALWLIARTIDRSSWRAGIAAGAVVGFIAIGRDQVALLSLYVVIGFISSSLVSSRRPLSRIRRSLIPLVASALTAMALAAVPVGMTLLLASRSNRPEVRFPWAAAGSLHPAHFLQFAFPDLFGAMSPGIEYWAPGTPIWNAVWGPTKLYLSQNMGLVYCGALPLTALVWLGVIRGLAWDPEIRYFTAAAALLGLYALGEYTPAFRLMFDLIPMVSSYRRPADATFVLATLTAVIAGYLVHRWLADPLSSTGRWQRIGAFCIAGAAIAAALAIGHLTVGIEAAAPGVASSVVFVLGAVAILAMARLLSSRSPMLSVALVAAFMAVDLAWSNAPHVSTGLPPAEFDVLRLGTNDETVRVIKSRLAETAEPDRRDRVESVGVSYYWPNLALVHDFDQIFGQNPLRLRWFEQATFASDTVAIPSDRVFSPLYPSYRSAFADLLGVRWIATGVPVEQIDSALNPGDLRLIARTPDAFVYENPRALPRVMLVTDWRLVDFDRLYFEGWPDVDPRRTVLLEEPPKGLQPAAGTESRGKARLIRYRNTEVEVEIDAGDGGILLLNDVWDPWWRASVDGIEVSLMRANVIFRAVVCPPGRHRVRFHFEPLAGAYAELMDGVLRPR